MGSGEEKNHFNLAPSLEVFKLCLCGSLTVLTCRAWAAARAPDIKAVKWSFPLEPQAAMTRTNGQPPAKSNGMVAAARSKTRTNAAYTCDPVRSQQTAPSKFDKPGSPESRSKPGVQAVHPKPCKKSGQLHLVPPFSRVEETKRKPKPIFWAPIPSKRGQPCSWDYDSGLGSEAPGLLQGTTRLESDEDLTMANPPLPRKWKTKMLIASAHPKQARE